MWCNWFQKIVSQVFQLKTETREAGRVTSKYCLLLYNHYLINIYYTLAQIHIYTYAYIYIHRHIHVYMYHLLYICVLFIIYYIYYLLYYIYIYICVCVCLHVCMCICVYKLIGILTKYIFQNEHFCRGRCWCICAYVYTQIHIFTRNLVYRNGHFWKMYVATIPIISFWLAGLIWEIRNCEWMCSYSKR